MGAYQLRPEGTWEIPDEEWGKLERQLSEEIDDCTEVDGPYRSKAKKFLAETGIWSLTDVTYETRCGYEAYLKREMAPGSAGQYLSEFDRVKRHSIKRQAQTLAGKRNLCRYQNRQLFLPYHPNPDISDAFRRIQNRDKLVWDFERKAPEALKRQVFKILHKMLGANRHRKKIGQDLCILKEFYHYCADMGAEDIEALELEQIQGFYGRLEAGKHGKAALERSRRIVDISRKTLFLEGDEINWKANVWYLERFHFEKTRVNPASSIVSLSFLEILQKKDRRLLQEYARYCLGTTNLSVSLIRWEIEFLRQFLVKMQNFTETDICLAKTSELERYFSYLEQRGIQSDTYNRYVKCILHFFDYLKVRGFLKSMPFQEQYYLKKTMPKHHDRSVTAQVYEEIMQKLSRFPEDLRLMFLNQWAAGLRASEVCTLKGNAYYVQAGDAWMQVYQMKMKNYKRIPIPAALYQLMKIYMNKYKVGPEEYIFKSKRGGAYRYGTYRKRMLQCCEQNEIGSGQYLFRSHDYRHKLATFFYDQGVSIQGIRDYLGHAYEEMTEQYIDYMPQRIRKANEEYFEDGHHSLTDGIEKRSRHGT